MAYTTATLTGTYKTFDDQPASGVVEIIPNSRQLVDAEGDVILAGRVKVTLDEAGSFSVTLPATDDATVEPATGRQYTVVAKLRHTHLPAVTGVELATGATVDVADVASAPVVDPAVSLAATTAQLATLEADVDAAIALKADAADLAPVATTGAYTDLTGQPAIPAAPEDVGAEPAGLSAATEAAISATYAGRGDLDIATFPGGRTVGFMGASITAGSSATTTSQNFQTIAANKAGTQKVRRWGESINGGVAGETSTSIAARVQGVIDQGAEMLVLGPDFGTNSAGNSVTLAQFQTDVLSSVGKAQQAGIPIVVCTTAPRASGAGSAIHTLLRTYNTWLVLWAAAAGVPLVDTHAALVDTATGYLAATNDSGDGVHLSDAGHLAVGNAIGTALAALVRDEPWPVKSPLPGYGMLVNPLVATTANWSGVATGTGTVTAAAPVAGDGLPAGNWLSIAINNSGGGSTVTTQRGATLDSTQWSVGDVLLVCYYAKSTASDARGLKIQMLNQSNVSLGVLLDTPYMSNPGPRMDVFTVPSGTTALRLSIAASALAGANVTHSIGAADVFNLTRAGLTAYA